MARGLTDYLGDWNIPEQSGDSRKNASGADTDEGGDSERGNPYRVKMPESPEWGLGKDGGTSFGHSDTVEVNKQGASWGMDKDEIAKGYSVPKSDGEGGVLETRQRYGSFEQSIPSTNEHDRGSGSASRAKEFKSTEGEGFDGVGNDKPSPGREAMGSREVNG
jgi:hypothetical protein